MFNSKRYDLKRLLWVMKTTQSWQKKVGCEIRATTRQHDLQNKEMQWLICAGQMEASANALQSWIEELERIVNELNEVKNDLSPVSK